MFTKVTFACERFVVCEFAKEFLYLRGLRVRGRIYIFVKCCQLVKRKLIVGRI